MSPASERLDVAVVARGLFASREKAKAAIAGGLVYVNGRRVAKPSTAIGACDVLEIRGETLRYVGRGGLKLERALEAFSVDVTGARCVDLGASTGGFTDCLLQHGAGFVISVDVGHGQLDARLAADPRVRSLEGTDARAVTPELLGGAVDVAVTDVSFISLAKVLPAMAGALRDGGVAICLIKPQFEAGREHVGKRGVVRDASVHRAVIERILGEAHAAGLRPRALDHSPITGPEGNIEYLLCAVRDSSAEEGDGAAADPTGTIDVTVVVRAAHEAFGR